MFYGKKRFNFVFIGAGSSVNAPWEPPVTCFDVLNAILCTTLWISAIDGEVKAAAEQIGDGFPRLRDLNYRGSRIHDRDWEDKYLSHRLRLQSRTIRLPAGTARRIF